MAKYCTKCGKQLPDGQRYCSTCAAEAERRRQNIPLRSNPPQGDVQKVTPNIEAAPDGTYRWVYEMSLLRNPSIFLTVWKLLFFVTLGVFAFIALITAAEGDMDGEAALRMLLYFGIAITGMTVLAAVSFLLYAAIMGGKYIAVFKMDDSGIRHRQISSQAKKAKGIAAGAVIIGLLSNNRAAVSGGIAAADTESTTVFAKTKKVRFYPKRDLIKIRHTLFRNQIYAKPEDFDFVRRYILARVPDRAKPKTIN